MSQNRKFGRHEGEARAACEDWQPLLSLSAAGGELDPAEESRLSAHLAECAECSDDFACEKQTLALLAAQHGEPDAALLAGCRAGLQDALDRDEDRGWISRSLGILLPSSWVSPRPAWSAAILLAIGFCVGMLAPRLLIHQPAAPATAEHHVAPRAVSRPPVLLARNSSSLQETAPNQPSLQGAGNQAVEAASAQAVPLPANSPFASAPASYAPSNPAPGSALAAIDMRQATVAGINLLPSGAGVPPEVRLQLAAPQPFTMQGTIDDGNVRDVLLYVLRHGDLFSPDVRLGAVNALSPRSQDPAVHSALSHALRQDASPAVRVSALQALDSSAPQDLVARMLLDAMSGDQDPGVREQAIDTLRSLADAGQIAPSDHMLSVLKDHMRNDPDQYIRAQSAAVVRELVSQQTGNQ
ncbi:MAG TPA: HEAT repeat domain-containing protein [Candidatus Dormibacteraeota bacterium]|nr:HEAT repeat domain-containing protein [Candidatus Dormibacteraeota bacterium]